MVRREEALKQPQKRYANNPKHLETKNTQVQKPNPSRKTQKTNTPSEILHIRETLNCLLSEPAQSLHQ
jgi:hypothetical protein